MGIIWIILALIIGLIINVAVATLMSNVAVLKGYGTEVHAFAACFWLGILGCIYVAALPDKIIQSQNQRIIELQERKAQ